jgi:curved DNA-binding protein CbpA
MGDIDQYYQILEIQPGASLEEVKQAYRDLVFVWHPDRFTHNDRLQQKAQQKITEINQAYQQLVLFLSQPELNAIEPQFQPPTPPAPVRENLNRKSFKKPTGRSGSQKSQNHRKATSKSQKGFKTPNRANFLGKRSNFKTPNRAKSTPKTKKQFSTQYSKPVSCTHLTLPTT